MIATAGHCVYKADRGGWAKNMFISIGQDASSIEDTFIDRIGLSPIQDQCPENQAACGQLRKNPNFTGLDDLSDVQFDYGAIILPNNETQFGQRAGWFIAENATDTEISNRSFNTA